MVVLILLVTPEPPEWVTSYAYIILTPMFSLADDSHDGFMINLAKPPTEGMDASKGNPNTARGVGDAI
jgi:hypothetical protein